jgi:thiamine transport system substrate-binding protein
MTTRIASSAGHARRHRASAIGIVGVVVLAGLALPSAAALSAEPLTAERITLVTHDAFALTPEVLASFEAQTGVAIDVLTAGDAGSMVNQSILAGDTPLGDVLYGVDTTFLSRALDAGILEPYEPAALAEVPAELIVDPDGRATPIDFGDVCLNLDLEAFADGRLPMPATLDDLLDPALRDTLVVEDPTVSSPGLAFLLATIVRYGDAGETTWRDWWRAARANGVQVAADWSDAYFTRFSGGASGGDRPIVVSYASSPVAEVIYADPRPETPPTAILDDGCFRQVEYAGVLTGTAHPAEARALVDWLLSPAVQADIPLSMFVTPSLASAAIPDDYRTFAAIPAAPLTMDPATIDANRDRWLDEWTEIVLR